MENAEVVNSLFPIQMEFHVFLALLAIVVFGIQFVRYRKLHYLLLAIAFPCTLLPYLDQSNMSLFYGVGVFEFIVFIISAVLSVTVDKDRQPAEISGNPDQNDPEQDSEEENL